MIEVRNLSKQYGPVVAVDDISFEVGKGEIIGFLGPNGAGKTTTMRILTGFSPPTAGAALVAGFDVVKQPVEVKKRVGYLPESVPLYTDMVVRSFLDYVATIKSVSRSDRKKEVDRVMERSGLTHMADRLIQNLSKGYRQRVGLAQSLIGNPPVLILDEPTVGLDPNQIVEIRQTIKDLAEEHTVLLSTHILPEVAMICERVLIINRGRIAAQDRMSNLSRSGSKRIFIELDRPGGETVNGLKTLNGVASVNAGAQNSYVIETTGNSELTSEITRRLVKAGLGVRRIEEKQRTLEEVFVEATTAEAVA